VRVKDPFDDLDVTQRKAVLITVCSALIAVLFALAAPTLAGLIAMIVAFFVMIMLHEFGHFVAAKRSGMKVTEFFVGFGPRLWSVRKGETEYGVKALPLGGYCKIIGMTNIEEVAPEDEPRAYRQKRWGPKVLVAAAGPLVHFALAIILMFTVLFFAGDFRESELTTTLAQTTNGAQAAGLQEGDQLIAINGVAINDWQQVRDVINPKADPAEAGDNVRFVVRRGDQILTRNVKLQSVAEEGEEPRLIAGILPKVYIPRPGLAASITQAPRRVASVANDSVKALGTVFSPSGLSNYYHLLAGDKGDDVEEDKRFLSPVGYAQVSYHAIKAGWVNAMGLLIAINVFVGMLNLLPLLPFDGGHIAVASYEAIASKIRRRRVQVDVNKLMPAMIVVLGLAAFIFISSLYLDISRGIQNPF
jgi:membrane-associated protease RseP (regulator of RpoE activity)